MATPIGATDENDCDLRCLINRLSGRRPLISPFDAPPQPNNRPAPITTTPAPDPGYISILLPVFLVIGVIILVVIIFLLHRFISILIKKRSRSGRNNGSSNSQSGQSNSSDFDDGPPSYLQMMGSLENSDLPPSYYEIVKGKVNLGFLTEEGNGGEEAGDRVEQVSEVDGNEESASSDHQQDSTNLPNAVAAPITEQEDEKLEKSDSKPKKVTTNNLQQRTKSNIEEEIDSLSVPTVFSSSPMVQPRSLSKRGNIKMLKVVPQLAAKRLKSFGVPPPPPENSQPTTGESPSESSNGSIL